MKANAIRYPDSWMPETSLEVSMKDSVFRKRCKIVSAVVIVDTVRNWAIRTILEGKGAAANDPDTSYLCSLS